MVFPARKSQSERRWALALLAFVSLLPQLFAQGALTNGFTHQAAVSPVGNVDAWSFTANSGERIVMRLGEISQAGTLNLSLIISNAFGLIASNSGPQAAEVQFVTTNSGSFSVIVSDVGADATGNYRMTFLRLPGEITVSAGDEGGTLTNGFTHDATLAVGDLDAWTFFASEGEGIFLKAGDATAGLSLYPQMRLFGPGGVLLKEVTAGAMVEIATRATNAGTYFVLMGNAENFSAGGNGNYRITAVRSATPIFVPSYDEGGRLTNDVTYPATNGIAGVDVWTFSACVGDGISLALTKLTGGADFIPELVLFSPEGELLNRVSSSTTANLNRIAPTSGSYLLIATATNSGLGTYQLRGNGFSNVLRLCPPERIESNLVATAIAGPSGGACVVLSSFNPLTPVSSWSVLQTNQFSSLGVQWITNAVEESNAARFFRVRSP